MFHRGTVAITRSSRRSLHLNTTLGKGAAKAPDERLLGLKSTEKTVAIFAGVSLLIGYAALKTTFSNMATKQPAEKPVRPIVVAGPSGTGKSTLLRKLFEEFPDRFGFSVSHTTRKPRPGEVNGREYHFTTREEMTKAIENGEFIEWAEFSGNMYGTSKKAVSDVLKTGKVCVLDIDMQGVRSVKKTDLNPVYVLVKPPSLEELEKRLRKRETETEESVQMRLEIAKEELAYAAQTDTFDHVVVNRSVDTAYEELKDHVTKSLLTDKTAAES